MIHDEETWHLLKAYIEENGLLRHQIGAFNVFIHETIPSIIQHYDNRKFTLPDADADNHETPSYTVKLGEYILEKPRIDAGATGFNLNTFTHTLTPYECLMRNISYVAKLYIDVTIKAPAGEPQQHKKILLGDIPVIVYSDLCNLKDMKNNAEQLAEYNEDPYDKGGYFVIGSKGKDGSAHRRVIVAQERAVPNRVFTFENRKQAPKYAYYSEIRSTNENGFLTTLCTAGIHPKSSIITVVLPYYDVEIPLGIIFTAMGITSLQDILHIVNPDTDDQKSILQKTLEHTFEYTSQETCLLYIGERKKKKTVFGVQLKPTEDGEEEEAPDADDPVKYAMNIFENHLFIHMFPTGKHSEGCELIRRKAYFLGTMINELLRVATGKKKTTDRDHLSFKRVMDVNVLLGQQLNAAFKRLYNDIQKVAEAALRSGTGANILSAMKPSIITNSLGNALSNNKWNRVSATGVSQILEEFNYAGSLANRRKISVPSAAEGSKNVMPRDLHGSHYQVICPAETPEGKNVGLLKNLSVICMTTFPSDVYVLYDIVSKIGFEDVSNCTPLKFSQSVKLFINGSLIGIFYDCETADKFVATFRNLRRSGHISREISIARNTTYVEEVRILCDGGRMCYPAIIVNDGDLAVKYENILALAGSGGATTTWSDLCSSGIVEFIDKDEEDEVLLANYPSDIIANPTKKYTHCDLHPSTMYGIGGSLVPFPDHNQSPRNCYQANMGKQAVGIPFLNYRNMIAGKFHTLAYPQKPLALSRMGSLIEFDEMPAGQNAVVAIMPRPFNEEDSIEFSKSAVQRGFMTSYLHTAYYTEARNSEKFMLPQDDAIRSQSRYSKLDVDGIVFPGSKVEKGDVLLCKVVTHPVTKKETVITTTYSHMWPAMIDKVQVGTTGDGYPYARVMCIQKRDPIVGDKFAARHGQKGTIGMLWNQEDMPFDRHGICPDVIINSLAFPSRMTIAMLIEAVTGMAVCSDSMLHEVGAATMDAVLNPTSDTAKKLKAVRTVEKYRSRRVAERYSDMFYNSPAPVDATPYRHFDISILKAELKRIGIKGLCDEVMTDGITGEMYKCLVFRGIVYYQRLKHMVIDKIHARARGGMNILTRQPKEGRGQGGGLRFGVQERDCSSSQGASHMIKDRMLDQSDTYSMWFCKICGLPAIVNEKTDSKECKVCSTNQVVKVTLPYGTKLVYQELSGMGIFNRIMTTPRE